MEEELVALPPARHRFHICKMIESCGFFFSSEIIKKKSKKTDLTWLQPKRLDVSVCHYYTGRIFSLFSFRSHLRSSSALSAQLHYYYSPSHDCTCRSIHRMYTTCYLLYSTLLYYYCFGFVLVVNSRTGECSLLFLASVGSIVVLASLHQSIRLFAHENQSTNVVK